jgi:hypothetical protein
LAALHRAFDLIGFEKRCVGMYGNFEFAGRSRIDIFGELDQIFRMEIGCRIGGRQVPFGLSEHAASKK